MSERIVSYLIVVSVWFFVLLSILVYLEIRDWWRYSSFACRLRCKIIGHDYHNGAAKNLKVITNDGLYIYDFCQRCHTQQNYRKEQ